ncbi:MAG: HEAT repeat domain-containing protein, partial [Planctomycetota bacterium]
MKITRTICNSSALLLLCCFAVCFGASEPQDEAVGIVLDILKSGDQEMQAVAIAMVKDMPGAEVTKALVKELPNLSTASQVQLLSALSDRGDAAALPAVITAVKAEDESVRIAALKAVGQLGDESSVDLLARTAAAIRGAEQKAARESLYRLRGAKVDEAILAGITKAEPKTKVELIKSAGERNISAGVSTLLKTSKDSDRKVRLESLKVLKVIAVPEHLPALVELLLNLQSSSGLNEARKMIASVAHKIEDKNRQAEAVLSVLPSVKDVKKQCSLLSVLGKIGDRSALPRLREALGSDNTDKRGAAIRALAEWPTSEPAADLMKAAENSENKVHRILALRGAVQLLSRDNKRSAEETIGMYKKAMSLAPDAGEKKRVLSGLANTKSLDALTMAT